MKLYIIAAIVFSLLLLGCTMKTWPPLNAGMCEQFGDVSQGSKGVDQYTKSDCYMYVAARDGDINLCSKVSNLYKQQSCILGVAAAKKDASFCQQLIERSMKELCLNVSAP